MIDPVRAKAVVKLFRKAYPETDEMVNTYMANPKEALNSPLWKWLADTLTFDTAIVVTESLAVVGAGEILAKKDPEPPDTAYVQWPISLN